jgi:hypothetical protein
MASKATFMRETGREKNEFDVRQITATENSGAVTAKNS